MDAEEKRRLTSLAEGLILFGMDGDDALLIIQAFVGMPQRREKMLFWLADHPCASPEEIWNQVLEIINEREKNDLLK